MKSSTKYTIAFTLLFAAAMLAAFASSLFWGIAGVCYTLSLVCMIYAVGFFASVES